MCNGRRETVAMRSPPLINEKQKKKKCNNKTKISPTKKKHNKKYKKNTKFSQI